MLVRRSLLSAGLSLAMLAGLSLNAAALELAVNGGFETGDFTGWTQFPQTGSQTIVSPGNGSAFAANLNAPTPNVDEVIKNANRGIGQVSPGDEVTISFDYRGSIGIGGVIFAEFFSELDGGGVSAAEILGGGPLFPNEDPNVWTTYSTTAIAGPDVAGGVTLQLKAGAGASFADIFFDNASMTIPGAAIPEPTSVALLGMGGIALVGLRRRRS